MTKNFFRRLFGGSEHDADEAHKNFAPNPAPQPEQPRIYSRRALSELQLSFYETSEATVEFHDYEKEDALLHQQRIVLDYYAETLFRLGTNEAAAQLQQYIAALCPHLIEGGELKRINLLGNLMRLLIRPPEEGTPTYFQKVILYRNEDHSLETEFSEPMLPSEYYLPTSMLLLMQHMLYSLSEEDMAELLMALSAMHTFYVTRYSFTAPEGRQLSVRHAVSQLEHNQERLSPVEA